MEQEITESAAYKSAEGYEHFIVSNILRYWTPKLLERAAPYPGAQVLDVACGTGAVARTVVPLVRPGGKVTGVDLNPAMLAVACRQFSEYCDEIDWQEGTAERLPFPDQAFDLVVCQQGLQFFKDRPAAAREMRRVLRKGGRVGIEVWQSLDVHPVYLALFKAAAAALNTSLENVGAPFMYGDPAALANLLTEAGFQQVRVESVGLDASFPDPNKFAELMFLGAAAVIPAFMNLDSSAQNELKTAVNREVAGVLKEYTVRGALVIQMSANIATAICSDSPRGWGNLNREGAKDAKIFNKNSEVLKTSEFWIVEIRTLSNPYWPFR